MRVEEFLLYTLVRAAIGIVQYRYCIYHHHVHYSQPIFISSWSYWWEWHELPSIFLYCKSLFWKNCLLKWKCINFVTKLTLHVNVKLLCMHKSDYVKHFMWYSMLILYISEKNYITLYISPLSYKRMCDYTLHCWFSFNLSVAKLEILPCISHEGSTVSDITPDKTVGYIERQQSMGGWL